MKDERVETFGNNEIVLRDFQVLNDYDTQPIHFKSLQRLTLLAIAC